MFLAARAALTCSVLARVALAWIFAALASSSDYSSACSAAIASKREYIPVTALLLVSAGRKKRMILRKIGFLSSGFMTFLSLVFQNMYILYGVFNWLTSKNSIKMPQTITGEGLIRRKRYYYKNLVNLGGLEPAYPSVMSRALIPALSFRSRVIGSRVCSGN